jgi:hypothetical protein
VIGIIDITNFNMNLLVASFLEYIGWYNNKQKYFTCMLALLWVFVGISYGLFYEKWDMAESVYFSLGAMSALGSPTPVCIPYENNLSSSMYSNNYNKINNSMIGHLDNQSIKKDIYNLFSFLSIYFSQFYANIRFSDRNSSGNSTFIISNEFDSSVSCYIDTFKALYLCIYIMIGIPFFTLVLGQFSITFVERAIRLKEIQLCRDLLR